MLTQHNQEFRRYIPDPLSLLGVGSGHETKLRLPHLRPAHPHLRVRGWFLSENAAMPPGQQVKVHKSASFVDILEVSKFTTFCDRKGYTGIGKSLCYQS